MIHHITIKAFAHATEDPSRVKKALQLFIPEDHTVEICRTEGHFGNPITIFTAKLKRSRQCRAFMDVLKSGLSASELTMLINQANQRVDDSCNFYIKLDKQSAYDGAVRLAQTGDAISIRIKIKAYPAKRENAIKIVESLLSDAQVL
ncbi:MAG: RNA-binding protein [Methanocellales archaeon]|nr:RNA-binding protein [Methanocellales archaeon]